MVGHQRAGFAGLYAELPAPPESSDREVALARRAVAVAAQDAAVLAQLLDVLGPGGQVDQDAATA